MTNAFFSELKEDLKNGATERDHPFRYFTFATVGSGRIARLRTVVLRKVDSDLKLTFYADQRSKKVIHIKENNNVSLLFYNPGKLFQLRIDGVATIIEDENIKKNYWNDIGTRSQKEYTSATTPGSVIENPDTLGYLKEENHFCAIEIQAFKIEYLKLRQPSHLRVRFSKEGLVWKSDFLAP